MGPMDEMQIKTVKKIIIFFMIFGKLPFSSLFRNKENSIFKKFFILDNLYKLLPSKTNVIKKRVKEINNNGNLLI